MLVNNQIANEWLYKSIIASDLKQAQAALDAGADLNLQNANGNTALHFAASNRDLAMVQCLLKAGAHLINLQDVNGVNALQWAINTGHLPVVECLIAAGADIHSQDVDGVNALHWATKAGHLPVVECLLPKLSLSEWDRPNRAGQRAWDLIPNAARPNFAPFLKTARQDRFVLFALGRHRRAGADSPVRVLIDDVISILYGEAMNQNKL